MSAVRIGRAFSPQNCGGAHSWGDAPGWYQAGPLALQDQTCASSRSLASFSRAKGATSYQPGASPQEWNHPTKQRAESPFHRVAGYETGNHFRVVTKMVPDEFPPKIPAAGFYQRTSSQGILDYSNRRRKRVIEDSSATENSAARGVFTPRSRSNRQGILGSSNRTTAQGNYRGILGSSNGGRNDVLGLPGIGIGRAFSPREIVSTGFLGRCPRLVWRWAFGPETQTAPTARFHTSLGQRPRSANPTTA